MPVSWALRTCVFRHKSLSPTRPPVNSSFTKSLAKINKLLERWVSRAWYEDKAWIKALAPLSAIYAREANKRKRLALENLRPAFSVPIVVVGNITTGGTGKSPLIVYLAKALKNRGINIGIISRGYGSGGGSGSKTARHPHRVSLGDDAAICGDEPLMIAEMTGVPVVVGRDRCAAVEALINSGIDLILSDDGLQHYALPRNFEIAVVDGDRGFGNGKLLPAGPLREPVARLKSTDFVVLHGTCSDADHLSLGRLQQESIRIDASFSMKPSGWVNVKTGTSVPLDFVETDQPAFAVAGIGNPQRFFNSLRDLGIAASEHAFSDHHPFVEEDFSFLPSMTESLVLMTMKDALKCRSFAGDNFWALDVDLVFEKNASDKDGGQQLLDRIQALLK